ncbi:hypothetical protein L198_00869 [Cryptococcus wingfieldii CBS 7118]|uniref:Extracellular membrane protein CFEM domain-containing protein n=1 Tax=Cryptococcus wingfieldii CBS 7118 TaxID=1295528 RepID=A0A1E3K2C1_9TREE|nr:hypothetical protein L198_00869 [Cryptococcus wingfieldii CBS 7118]ODO07290.1 hypothetical protein L198_00869 [Cryptococcus wingfieldii CBS 7118]
MLAATFLTVLSAASAVVALPGHSLNSREYDINDIDASCQSTCSSTVTLYQSCNGGTTSDCLKFCVQDTFSDFITCAQCNLDAKNGTESDMESVESAISTIKNSCSFSADPVTGDVAPASTGSATSGSDSTAASASTTAAGSASAAGSSEASGVASSISNSSSSSAGTPSIRLLAGSAGGIAALAGSLMFFL